MPLLDHFDTAVFNVVVFLKSMHIKDNVHEVFVFLLLMLRY